MFGETKSESRLALALSKAKGVVQSQSANKPPNLEPKSDWNCFSLIKEQLR